MIVPGFFGFSAVSRVSRTSLYSGVSGDRSLTVSSLPSEPTSVSGKPRNLFSLAELYSQTP